MSMSLGNVNFATKYAKATAVTVYLMTGVKATVRPLFNYNDKKADKDSRKYSAVNEFLYQMVCLAIAAGMIPFCEAAGFKMAEKRLGQIAEKFKKSELVDGFEELAKAKGIGFSGSKKIAQFRKLHLQHSFDEAHVAEVKAAKDAKAPTEKQKVILKAEKAEHLLNGGIETGSFVGSIVGLTIAAPWLSHKILHPIMKALGLKGKAQNHNDKKVDVKA